MISSSIWRSAGYSSTTIGGQLETGDINSIFGHFANAPSSKSIGPGFSAGPNGYAPKNKRDRILVHVRFFGLLHLRQLIAVPLGESLDLLDDLGLVGSHNGDVRF